MINLKIRMINGEDFNLSHPTANNAQHWIRLVLMPMGTQLRWVELFPGRMIQTDNIQEVRLLTEEEINEINSPKEEPTPEAENNTGTEEKISKVEEADVSKE